jgi:predicted polyphosphate/ATP-dependent NAD kinase
LLDQHGGPAEIIVTAIGGQGHIFGRGNQQLSPAVIRAVGTDNITLVAAKSKIAALEGRPLLVDTNDPELDRALAGYRRVITGYEDAILYPVAGPP